MAPVSHPVAPRLFNDFHLAPGLGGIRLAGLAGLADPEVPSGRGPAPGCWLWGVTLGK